MQTSVQTILALALGKSTRSTLAEVIQADRDREELGQIPSGEVSGSEPEMWQKGASANQNERLHSSKNNAAIKYLL